MSQIKFDVIDVHQTSHSAPTTDKPNKDSSYIVLPGTHCG